jgi:hypothetical protein
LKIEIEKGSKVPPPTEKLYKERRKLWDDFKDQSIILAAKINKFVDMSIFRALSNNEGDRPPNRKVNNEHKIINNKSKNNKTERNQRQRYVYARCQDIFHECLRKLVSRCCG